MIPLVSKLPGKITKPKYRPVPKTVAAGIAYTCWCPAPACGQFLILLPEDLKPDVQHCNRCLTAFRLTLPEATGPTPAAPVKPTLTAGEHDKLARMDNLTVERM